MRPSVGRPFACFACRRHLQQSTGRVLFVLTCADGWSHRWNGSFSDLQTAQSTDWGSWAELSQQNPKLWSVPCPPRLRLFNGQTDAHTICPYLSFTFRLIARRYTELILGALPSANFSLSASYELETDRPRASFSDGVSIQFSTFRYPLFFDRAIRTGTKACLRVGVPFRPTRHYSRGT